MQIGLNRSLLAQGEDAAAGTPTFQETSYLGSLVPSPCTASAHHL